MISSLSYVQQHSLRAVRDYPTDDLPMIVLEHGADILRLVVEDRMPTAHLTVDQAWALHDALSTLIGLYDTFAVLTPALQIDDPRVPFAIRRPAWMDLAAKELPLLAERVQAAMKTIPVVTAVLPGLMEETGDMQPCETKDACPAK